MRSSTVGKETPLSQVLNKTKQPQPTPLEVFRLARKRWLANKRINVGELANTVGVSRVTVYRWVGTRERLINEILWSFAKPSLAAAVKEIPGQDVTHIVEIIRRFMTEVAAFAPMRRFLMSNPIFAVRLQTSDPESHHGRLITAAANYFSTLASSGDFTLVAPAHQLAEMVVYTSAALLYSAILSNRPIAPTIQQICSIDLRVLQGEICSDT